MDRADSYWRLLRLRHTVACEQDKTNHARRNQQTQPHFAFPFLSTIRSALTSASHPSMLWVKLQTHLIEATVSAKTEQSPSTTCATGKLTCDADRRDDSLLHSTSSYQSDAVLDRCPLKT